MAAETIDPVLFFLLKNGAHKKPMQISTTELGRALGISQQNASRLLILMEKQGKIERKGSRVSITKLGLTETKKFFVELRNALEARESSLKFNGVIVSGLGEGKYYVSKYAKKIKTALGFKPFLGTLNVKLDRDSIDKRSQLLEIDPITIKGFVENGRSFGDIFAYRCRINGISAVVIIPVRTHHGTEILEIIASKNLLNACNKKIGGKVHVTIS